MKIFACLFFSVAFAVLAWMAIDNDQIEHLTGVAKTNSESKTTFIAPSGPLGPTKKNTKSKGSGAVENVSPASGSGSKQNIRHFRFSYVGDGKIRNALKVRLEFLKSKRIDYRAIEELVLVGTEIAVLRLDESVGVVVPPDATFILPTVLTPGFALSVLKENLQVAPFDQLIHISESSEIEIDVGDGSKIEGSVIDSVSRSPLRGARISLLGGRIPIEKYMTLSTEEGRFSFKNLHGSRYAVVIHFEGRVLDVSSDFLPAHNHSPGQDFEEIAMKDSYVDHRMKDTPLLVVRAADDRPLLELVLPLTPPISIEGRLLDQGSSPVPNFPIIATHAVSGASMTTSTDPDGRFVLEGASPGIWAFRLFQRRRRSEFVQEEEILPGRINHVTLVRPQSSPFSIKAVTESGEPIAGLVFSLISNSGSIGKNNNEALAPTNELGLTSSRQIFDTGVSVIAPYKSSNGWVLADGEKAGKGISLKGSESKLITFRFQKGASFDVDLDLTRIPAEFGMIQNIAIYFGPVGGENRLFIDVADSSGKIRANFPYFEDLEIREVGIKFKDSRKLKCKVMGGGKMVIVSPNSPPATIMVEPK